MSLLIYKQRFVNPNLKTTANKNYAHVRYIATRPRVAKHEGRNHGLFGKLAPGTVEEFKDWRDIAKLVYQNSKKHITMYRTIISFQEETAKELLLTDKRAWQRYIEKHIMTIAEKNHINREHLQWACALHKEKKHPHIHVVFWDTSARVRNPYTPEEIPMAIRRQMIKDTFASRIRDYGEQKNLAIQGLRSISDELVDKFEHDIRKADKSKWCRSEALAPDGERKGALEFADNILTETAKQIAVIRESIPAKGRIAYQLLPPQAKGLTDALVAYLLKQIPLLNQKKTDYIDSKMQMVLLYGGTDSYMEDKKKSFEKEADKVIANRILGMVKRLNRLETEQIKLLRLREKRWYFAEQMILEALEMLAFLTEASDRQYEEWQKKNLIELSKEARKELYRKLQDKGYEH